MALGVAEILASALSDSSASEGEVARRCHTSGSRARRRRSLPRAKTRCGAALSSTKLRTEESAELAVVELAVDRTMAPHCTGARLRSDLKQCPGVGPARTQCDARSALKAMTCPFKWYLPALPTRIHDHHRSAALPPAHAPTRPLPRRYGMRQYEADKSLQVVPVPPLGTPPRTNLRHLPSLPKLTTSLFLPEQKQIASQNKSARGFVPGRQDSLMTGALGRGVACPQPSEAKCFSQRVVLSGPDWYR